MDFFLLHLFFSSFDSGFVRVTQSINSFNCYRLVFFFLSIVFSVDFFFVFSIERDVRCLFSILSFWSNGIQMFNVQPLMGNGLSLSSYSLRNKISFFNFGTDLVVYWKLRNFHHVLILIIQAENILLYSNQ